MVLLNFTLYMSLYALFVLFFALFGLKSNSLFLQKLCPDFNNSLPNIFLRSAKLPYHLMNIMKMHKSPFFKNPTAKAKVNLQYSIIVSILYIYYMYIIYIIYIIYIKYIIYYILYNIIL